MHARQLGYRGQQVIAFVNGHTDQGRRPPSYSMIAIALGMNSIADVCNVVRRLERRGLLQRGDTGTRHRRGWHLPVIVANAP